MNYCYMKPCKVKHTPFEENLNNIYRYVLTFYKDMYELDLIEEHTIIYNYRVHTISSYKELITVARLFKRLKNENKT